MSLQIAAQHLASRGRGPDTQLVHMTKGEVSGLQALAKAHGGSLTINPDTGLPEAGILSSILPMVIGAGITYFSGGTLGPMAAAMMTGAGYTAATGSLQKGLMAGLGAYGGAGLTGGLMGAGATEAVGGALAGSAPTAGAAATAPTLGNAVGTAAAETAATNASSVVPGAADNLQNFYQSPLNSQLDQLANAQLTAPITPMPSGGVPPMASFTPNPAALGPTDAAALRMPSPYEQLGRGFDRVTSSGANALDFAKDNAGTLGSLGLAALSGMDSNASSLPVRNSLQPFNYSYDPKRVSNPQEGYTGAASGQRTYFNPTFTRMAADGGLMDAGPVGAMSQENQPYMNPAYAAGGVSDAAVDAYTGAEKFAAGGISTLGGYSDGGQLLRGPGDGVSDSIPADIGGKQPARLADGEFVVSADVVSGLGNGSTEAGAKQLYAMMERVRKARTGTKKMGKTVSANKMVPA